MEKQRDLEFVLTPDTRKHHIKARMAAVGGLPIVVLALDTEGRCISQGRGCVSFEELIEAMTWAWKCSPIRRVRIIPATTRKDVPWPE
jgi:hypothetical protein